MRINKCRPKWPGQSILCVDVCGTLYSENTTAGFALFHHRFNGSKWREFLINIISGRWNPLVYAVVIAGKVYRKDFHRALVIASLKGESRSALQRSASCYIEYLDKKAINSVHTFVEGMRELGWRTILVSNSIDVVVQAVAKKKSLEFVASEIAWTDDKCAGRISVDLTGQKRWHVENYLNRTLDVTECAVITDNESDSDLISVAQFQWLVAKDRSPGWMYLYPQANIVRLEDDRHA